MLVHELPSLCDEAGHHSQGHGLSQRRQAMAVPSFAPPLRIAAPPLALHAAARRLAPQPAPPQPRSPTIGKANKRGDPCSDKYVPPLLRACAQVVSTTQLVARLDTLACVDSRSCAQWQTHGDESMQGTWWTSACLAGGCNDHFGT